MRIANGATIARGTDPSLVELALWRARFEVSRGLSRGQSPEKVREAVVMRFRLELEQESYGDYTDELLMSVIQRTKVDASIRAVANS